MRWGISADGNEEVSRVEFAAIEKRAQVLALREAVESRSATPAWPESWPDVADFSWRWFMLTRDVPLTRDIDAGGVTIRSVQLLQHALKKGARLADLVSALDAPPVPASELRPTHWSRFKYGDVSVEVELINA